MTSIAVCNESVKHSAFEVPTPATPRRRRRGISIFGVILGVGVAALVAAGLVTAYQGVITNTRSNTVASLVLTASTNVRRAFANVAAINGTGWQASINAIIYSSAPTNLQNVSGSTIANGITFPWWAGATLRATAAAADTFTLTVASPPSPVCEAVASRYVNVADVSALTVGGTSVAGGVNIGTECGDGTAANRSVAITFRG